MNSLLRIILAAALVVAVPIPSSGQTPHPDGTVPAVAGARYDRFGAWRWMWGAHYRDAWATTFEVDLLDLDEFAGGLTPVRSGRGRQTRSLIFAGADGRSYAFRSVDKNAEGALAEDLRQTVAVDIIQDQISSQHPVSSLVTSRLEEAAGILHVEPRLFIMPDDPRLGEFGDEFAGMLGLMVERPGDHSDESAIFAGADQVADGQQIFDIKRASPLEQVDARAFLAARLLDILVGDWDRHRYQWRWARIDGSDLLPIPEDRDQSFARLDGVIPSQAHRFVPELVSFKPEYPSIVGLTFTAQEIDRNFLTGLGRPEWDSVASALAARLTDEVIEDAVRRLPAELYELDGAIWIDALKQRRDHLLEAASDYYGLLARIVEIQATDVAERAVITRNYDGSVEVTLAALDGAGPYFRRHFDPGATREIRIRLHGGDDVAVFGGAGDPVITVRVIGGEGDDEFRYDAPLNGLKLYDQHGSNRVTGATRGAGGVSTSINSNEYTEWEYATGQERPPRQWGSSHFPIIRLGVNSDFGLLVGLGTRRSKYGFRKHPYARRWSGGFGITTTGKLLLLFDADLRRENSPVYFGLNTFFSQLNVINFFGFGNDTQVPDGASTDFFKVDLGQFVFDPAIGWDLGGADVRAGATVRYSSTKADSATFLGSIPNLYGVGDFWQTGAFAAMTIDTRDVPAVPTRGAALELGGWLFPEALDVESTYGYLQALAATYLTARIPLQPTLALRAGGRKTWGDPPYFDAAFIGGAPSLRGFDQERFAGDASLYGSAELRLFLGHRELLIPGDFGLHGSFDAGRVWVDGDSPGDVHTGYGGGLWFSFLGRQNTLSITLMKSTEGTRFYIRYGMPF
jgi:hypothetical protein